jgi:UDP-glucose 4-epimerase
MRFHKLDLTSPVAHERLSERLAKERVDCVVHAAFRRFPTADVDYDHELETLGSRALLRASADAGVRHFVLASSTMLYGPRPDNPTYLDESRPLHGHPEAHCIANRVEVEGLVREVAKASELEFSVLRHCWVMGPSYRDFVVDHFESPTVQTVLGYDPLLQLIHEEDLLDVFEQAVMAPHPGVYNVVGKGVLALSSLLALADRPVRSLPMPLLRRTAFMRERNERGDLPAGFYDYLRYLWVADGERGWQTFGEPVYSTREAWMAFVGSRLMQRYR